MRRWILALALLWCLPTPGLAQVNIQIGLPGIAIGVNQPVYPQLVLVPGSPVYYVPGGGSNYFFYEGMYWAYEGDGWYASSWFNGPWAQVTPQAVPLFILRVPVRYYGRPPAYFRGWRADRPPRWGEHWGSDWERKHQGWDRWSRISVPRPAPLPAYQKQYSGNRYPQAEMQHALQVRNYGYQIRDAAARDAHQAQGHPDEGRRPDGGRNGNGQKDKGKKDKGHEGNERGSQHDG